MNVQSEDHASGSRSNSTAPQPRLSGAVAPAGDPSGDGPMTWSLLGRLFGLPLLIIGVIVGSAMIVVLSFGAPAASQQRSLEGLLLALESGSGRKSMGMLFPRDKEHWQAGLELTKRLETKDREFTDADLKSVALRVGSMVRAELADIVRLGKAPSTAAARAGRHLPRTGATIAPGATQAGPTRLDFLIRALGLTEQPSAVDVLVEVIECSPDHYSAVAMQQLGNLAHLPGASDAVEPILDTLTGASSSEAQLVACTVLSVLADATDQRVIDALAAKRLSTEHGEVAWSAALALARLGSAEGKSTLMDLLDRSFWETGNRYRETNEEGKVLRYRMPPSRVDNALMAAIDAASNLHGADLWEMIKQLQSDPSPVVRSKAAETVSRGSRQDEEED